MARTLNESLRKRRGGPTAVDSSSSSKPSSASASSEQPQDTSLHKAKSELARWLSFGTKKSKGSRWAPSLITIESSDDESARVSTRDESSSREKHSESETQLPMPCEAASLSASLEFSPAASSHAKAGTNKKEAIEIDGSDEEEEEEEIATSIEIKDDDDVIQIDDDDDSVVVEKVASSRASSHSTLSRSIQPSPVPSSSIQHAQRSPNGSISSSRRSAKDHGGKNIVVGDRLYTAEHYKTGMVKCHARTSRGTICRRVALKGPLCLTHHEIAKENGGELPELFAPDPYYDEQKDPEVIAFMKAMKATDEKEKGKKMPDHRRCLSTTHHGRRCVFATYQDFSFCKRHLKALNITIPHGNAPHHEKDSIETDSRSVASKSTGADNSPLGRKDNFWKEGQGKVQCEAITNRRRPCRYHTVENTTLCYLHADYLHADNDLKQAPVPRSVAKRMDDSEEEDDESTSLASSSSSFLPEYKWAGSDGAVHKGYRSVARAPKDSDESSAASGDESDENDPDRPYTHTEFLEMWHICEAYCGETAEDIENTRLIRGANSKMAPEDSVGQQKAQYGRLLPVAMKKLMGEILLVRKDDVFLDIGHGIGNTCIQAAFTVGCEARGIEVVYGRNSVGEVFRDNLVVQNADRPVPRKVGKVDLRYGRLEDLEHQEFLTKGVTRAYVNNFNGVFAERSQNLNQKWFLDDYCAGLFALMPPGAVMVTLHPLNLGQTRSEANDSRVKKGLNASRNSSFYEVEKVLLGKACDSVKWNQHSGNKKNIYVYKYSRVTQLAGDGRGVFLCSNPLCTYAKEEVALPATTTNEEDRCVINNCECKVTQKTLRRQRRKVYTDP